MSYNHRLEQGRKKTMTKEKILEIARRDGSFSVSLRWRDDWLRARCAQLRKDGHLYGGRKITRGSVVFHPKEKQNEQHPQQVQGCGPEAGA